MRPPFSEMLPASRGVSILTRRAAAIAVSRLTTGWACWFAPGTAEKPEGVTSTPGNLMKSPFAFKQYGQCGRWVSSVFPHLAKQVDRMADEIKRRLKDGAAESERLAALNEYLFKDNGFHGSRTDYYHRANSYISRVIDDREYTIVKLFYEPDVLTRRLEEVGWEANLRRTGEHFLVGSARPR